MQLFPSAFWVVKRLIVQSSPQAFELMPITFGVGRNFPAEEPIDDAKVHDG